jgi:hypothetical protein
MVDVVSILFGGRTLDFVSIHARCKTQNHTTNIPSWVPPVYLSQYSACKLTTILLLTIIIPDDRFKTRKTRHGKLDTENCTPRTPECRQNGHGEESPPHLPKRQKNGCDKDLIGEVQLEIGRAIFNSKN